MGKNRLWKENNEMLKNDIVSQVRKHFKPGEGYGNIANQMLGERARGQRFKRTVQMKIEANAFLTFSEW